MSKKSRDTSTLFELIAQTGGRIRGVTPADRKADPPPAESATEAAAPPPPAPPPLLEQQPPESPAPEHAPEEHVDTAPAKPPEAEPEADAKTTPAAAPAAKPIAKAKKKQKKAVPKRAAKTKAAVKVPAKPRKGPADEDSRPPARAKAERPADVKPKSAPPLPVVEKLAGEEAAAGAMPPGSAPPAHLQPERAKRPRPTESRSAVSVPFSQFAPFVGLAVTVVLMIAVFIVGFIAGRLTAPRPRAPQEQRSVVVANGAPAQAQLDAGLPTGTRVEGMHYLIIQELEGSSPEDLREAWDIRNFCEEYAHPADVRQYTKPSGREVYIVLSFQPFESPVGDEAEAFVEGVEQLGRTYEEQGGRYRFQQRLTPSGPAQPHFVTWRLPPAQN